MRETDNKSAIDFATKETIPLYEPTYRELVTLSKANIRQLLTIGIADSDEHIEKHFGGEIGLIETIQGYIDLTEGLIDLFKKEVQQ
jgi:hypothetical protein